MSIVLEHLVKEQGFTIEQAKYALMGWELRPIKRGGLQMGELMIKNNEVHFALKEDARRVMGRVQLLRRVLGELLEEKGFIVTKLYPHSKEAALVKAFGFTKTSSDGTYDYYWMDKGDLIGRRNIKREALHDSH
jgi:hypothetical protein